MGGLIKKFYGNQSTFPMGFLWMGWGFDNKYVVEKICIIYKIFDII